MTATRRAYIGRFAPSPTGPLHFGSLLAAMASYLEARCRHGRWLLRIEDIDPPREEPGAYSAIVRALEAYGFEWDGPVAYQSQNVDRHRELVARLLDEGHAYRCACSRQDLAEAKQGPLGPIYPGTCRTGCSAAVTAVRVRTNNRRIAFNDLLQGLQSQRLEAESGDFIVQRRDGLIAYHLAVVGDDFHQGITHIVRGADLLDSTPRQIHLQRLLGFSTPLYAHIPVVVNRSGQKLSKRTGATPIPINEVRPTLVAALEALRQNPPQSLVEAELGSIWAWATGNWSLNRAGRRETRGEPPQPP